MPIQEKENFYQRIELDYSLNALEPYISKEIMDDHYNGNHQAYEKNLNLILANLEEKVKESIKKNFPQLTQLLQNIENSEKLPISPQIKAEIRFYGGGLINHNLFFSHLAPQNISPREREANELVGKKFLQGLHNSGLAGLDGLKKELINAAKSNLIGDTRYGSYWTWLVLDKNRKMKIIKTANQDSPLMFNLIPLIGIDMWEHAYVKQYGINKNDYINNLVNYCLNWKLISDIHLQNTELK